MKALQQNASTLDLDRTLLWNGIALELHWPSVLFRSVIRMGFVARAAGMVPVRGSGDAWRGNKCFKRNTASLAGRLNHRGCLRSGRSSKTPQLRGPWAIRTMCHLGEG
jgi:hypothetical protein